MGTCEVCGNKYDMAFEVVAAGARHVFDSFECAIHKDGTGLRALWLQDHRPRRRGRGAFLLLRELRENGRRPGIPGLGRTAEGIMTRFRRLRRPS